MESTEICVVPFWRSTITSRIPFAADTARPITLWPPGATVTRTSTDGSFVLAHALRGFIKTEAINVETSTALPITAS